MSGSLFLERGFFPVSERFLYVPPSGCLKAVSGSFHGLFAGIFYIRGVLAISDEFKERAAWIDWVQRNFEAATELDPELIQAYFFAGVVVARDKEGIIKGNEFLKRGELRKPAEWQLPYWIAFNYYQAGDFLKAAEYFEKASNLPLAPRFLKTIQPFVYYRSGRPEMGLAYLEALRLSVKDPKQLESIETKLEWLKNIVYLEKKIADFRAKYGRGPAGLQELLDKGMLDKIPDDPFGKGYYYEADSGRIKSRLDIF